MTIRVLVADDQEMVRTGLTTILDTQPDIEVVGEAAEGREAVELTLRLRPDVCLFDIRVPAMDGIDATQQLAGPDVEQPSAVVIITTSISTVASARSRPAPVPAGRVDGSPGPGSADA